MKTLFRKRIDKPADSAMPDVTARALYEQELRTPVQGFAEAMDERLAMVAYAEAADYEDIRRPLDIEHGETIHPDECQFGDNDLCYVET